MTRVAFLGTGTMGLPMARNLARAGFELRAWNRTVEKARPLERDGVRICQEPAQAAAGADLLVTMLSDTVAVLDTAAGALPALAADAVWVQMSTIGLQGSELCEEAAADAGVQFVDAPVLGTREPAAKGELVVLASGPSECRARLAPLFDAVGKRTLWLGEAGQGTRAKVVINNWIVGVVGVLAETISLAEALELDPQVFYDAIEGGPLDLAYARLKGKAMIDKHFDDPAFRLSLSHKDAELVLDAAERGRLELPIAEAVRERLQQAEADGHGEEDMAATYWVSRPAHVPAGSRMTRAPRT
jgi:3-hydroxyisobutyrate dehydrogenase